MILGQVVLGDHQGDREDQKDGPAKLGKKRKTSEDKVSKRRREEMFREICRMPQCRFEPLLCHHFKFNSLLLSSSILLIGFDILS